MQQSLPTVPVSPETGDIIAGKYRLVRPIGLGAMGLVFEATHLRMQQRVAIKFMQAQLVSNPDAIARFEREGRAASRLTSPHATRIFDVDTTDTGVPYIVSELLEGWDLRQELDERQQLPVAEAVDHVIQACVVMAEAHSLGIVHRDLKPSNLFLAKTMTGRIVKVLDFGISKMDEELELTTTGVQLGSPRYMSPEQVEAKPTDCRADIWALGVILFRALSGAFPFDGSTSISLAVTILTKPPRDLSALVADVPPGLVHAIEKALEKKLAERYATARDFAEAIAPYGSPEAASLAKNLTREVRANAMSKPELRVSPDAETVVQPAVGLADIEVTHEAPEQATRGTWAQPSTVRRLRPQEGRSPGVAALAAVLVLSAVAAGFYFWAMARTPTSAPAAASAEAPGLPSSAGSAEAPVVSRGGPPEAPAASVSASTHGFMRPPAQNLPRPPARPALQPDPEPAAPAPRPPPTPKAKNPNYL